jgi:hypothetical protein
MASVPTFSRIANNGLPATLPLLATGIGGLGLLGWRGKRKARARSTRSADAIYEKLKVRSRTNLIVRFGTPWGVAD